MIHSAVWKQIAQTAAKGEYFFPLMEMAMSSAYLMRKKGLELHRSNIKNCEFEALLLQSSRLLTRNLSDDVEQREWFGQVDTVGDEAC